jgi:hypothetical protein
MLLIMRRPITHRNHCTIAESRQVKHSLITRALLVLQMLTCSSQQQHRRTVIIITLPRHQGNNSCKIIINNILTNELMFRTSHMPTTRRVPLMVVVAIMLQPRQHQRLVAIAPCHCNQLLIMLYSKSMHKTTSRRNSSSSSPIRLFNLVPLPHITTRNNSSSTCQQRQQWSQQNLCLSSLPSPLRQLLLHRRFQPSRPQSQTKSSLNPQLLILTPPIWI